MNQRLARVLTVLSTVALFVGTLMPGGWRDAGTRPFASVVDLNMVAHIVLFAAICFLVPHARWWQVRPWHVLALGMALALLTEGLQFFAVERRPGLDGLSYDLVGTVAGWALGRLDDLVGFTRGAEPAAATATGRSPGPSRRR